MAGISNPVTPMINGSVSHGDCESCDNKDCRITKCGSIWECDKCVQADIDAAMKHQAPELQEERLQAHKNVEAILISQIKAENASLRINPDIFNAKMLAISDLKKVIDAEPSIENKNFALARVLSERFQHLNTILHDKRQEIAEGENEQRAIQTFYNELSKSLRAEEREKIKLADANYKPLAPIVKTPKKKEEPKKNWDKGGVARAAESSGIAEALIQLTCLSRNVTPEMAVQILKESGVKGKTN